MNPFAPVGALAARHCDVPRPLRTAIVADVSGWSASGESWLLVDVDGDAVRRVIYRDGRLPLVGEAVQVILTGPDAGAPYLALPLPTTTPGTCTPSYYFTLNGARVSPPDRLPNGGGVFGGRVAVVYTLSEFCRHFYVTLRSYRATSANTIVDLYDAATVGPIDGIPGDLIDQISVGVVPTSGAVAYYLTFNIGTSPPPPPRNPGDPFTP